MALKYSKYTEKLKLTGHSNANNSDLCVNNDRRALQYSLALEHCIYTSVSKKRELVNSDAEKLHPKW